MVWIWEDFWGDTFGFHLNKEIGLFLNIHSPYQLKRKKKKKSYKVSSRHMDLWACHQATALPTLYFMVSEAKTIAEMIDSINRNGLFCWLFLYYVSISHRDPKLWLLYAASFSPGSDKHPCILLSHFQDLAKQTSSSQRRDVISSFWVSSPARFCLALKDDPSKKGWGTWRTPTWPPAMAW